jgi:YVTN family beta-propeller protein
VEVLETATGRLLDEIILSHQPVGVATSHDGKFVYVTDGSSIAVVEAITNRVANHVPARHFTTGYLIVSPDDRHLYAVCDGGLSVMALEGDSGVEIGFVDGVTAMGIGISPDGRYVYTTDWGDCTMQVVNTEELRIEKTIDLIPASTTHDTIPWGSGQVKAAGQAVGMSVSPDGRRAVVGIWAGSFAPVVDLANLKLEKAVPLDGSSYQCVAFSPDGRLLYISHYGGNRILVLDSSTFRLVRTINTAASPKNIAVTPDGKYLYVAHENDPVEILGLPDGNAVNTLFFTASKSGTNIAFRP